MIDLFWDTETARFGPGNMAPPLTCVSYLMQGEAGLLSYREAGDWFLENYENKDVRFVGHNVAYDFGVLAAEYPEFIPKIFDLYESNRVTDTMLRQMLLDNAMGCFRMQKRTYEKKNRKYVKYIKITYNLDACYYRVTKKKLDKDTHRLHYGELRDVPIYQWQEGAKIYPIQDAKATGTVHAWQEMVCRQIQERYLSIGKGGGHIKEPEPLEDQYRQARAAWWIQLMRIWGIRTDPERVNTLEHIVKGEYTKLSRKLIEAGLVRKDLSRNTIAAKKLMVKAMGGEDNCEKTEKGHISLSEEACRESQEPLLIDYAELSSLGTVISKDIKALRSGSEYPVHSNFNVFMATGRTSSSNPNIQNIRRLPGIRECFVPREGWVFLDADYDGLELRTLAQVCLSKLGRSKLAKVLNDGGDPHLTVASTVLNIGYEAAFVRNEKHDKEVEDARQLGKAANFGFPGGLGAKTLVHFAKGYGVDTLDEDGARDLKKDWIKAFPEMRDFLTMVGKHCQENKEENLANVEQLWTKRLRGEATFTQACNSYFQGLGADATKAAGFLIAKECYVDRKSPLFGSRIVNYIHDQFILECKEDRAHEAAHRLARVMEEGAKPFLPDVPATVSKPMVTKYWSKSASQKFDGKGRLIPWGSDEFKVEKKRKRA